MREFLLYHEEMEWHFFIKPFYGLCYRKKESGRFSPFEVLLPEACEDFSAISHGDAISVVCQEKNGSILTLIFRDNQWQKIYLLESKNSSPYPKYFTQIPRGHFINLFYVITHQDRQMLVHQILHSEERTPRVVDWILPGTPPFIASSGTGTDINVLYRNEAGASGLRTFRWSKKEFTGFFPIHPAVVCKVVQMQEMAEGRIRYVGFQAFNKLRNLVYFEQTKNKEYTDPVTIYLDCDEDASPIFCQSGEKLYLVWQEKGSVMSSYSADDGIKWSKPVRYVKNGSLLPVEYVFCKNGISHSAYGYEKDYEIIFYITSPLSLPPKERKKTSFQQKGYEVEQFAKLYGYLKEEEKTDMPDIMYKQLSEGLRELKKQFYSLRVALAALQKQLALSDETHIPLANREADIDDVLLGQFIPEQEVKEAD